MTLDKLYFSCIGLRAESNSKGINRFWVAFDLSILARKTTSLAVWVAGSFASAI
jgi:hypothetical protein